MYRDPVTGTPIGDAVIVFKDPYSATEAVRMYDGRSIEDNSNVIHVTIAEVACGFVKCCCVYSNVVE